MDKKYKRYGNELRYYHCPICGKTNYENPHFSINILTGSYKCFVTDKGGNIKNHPEWDLNTSGIEPEVIPKEKADFTEILHTSKHLRFFPEWIKYLKGRGITNMLMIQRLCRIGKYDSMLIPIFDTKGIVGIKYRSMNKKLFSERGSSNDWFLNWQNIDTSKYKKVYIVEGEIDCLSMMEAGYENTVSLPAGVSNLHCIDNQLGWIQLFDKIVIMPDNDDPGEKCKKAIIDKLEKWSDRLYEVNYGSYKDMNEVLMDKGVDGVKKIAESSTKIIKLDVETIRDNENFKMLDGAYYTKFRNHWDRITDFILELKGYSNDLIEGTIFFTDGRSNEFKCLRSDLLTPTGIQKNLGGMYKGKPATIIDFWDWMISKNHDKVLCQIEHYGIIDNKYYSPSSNVACNKNDLEIVNCEELEPLTDEELGWLKDNLIYMRSDPVQSLLGISWALGRLHSLDTGYPILEVYGTTSIGKSEYIEFIERITQGKRENIKNFSTTSLHQIRSLSSSSNITAWALDEVKIINRLWRDKANEVYSIIRAVYDNKMLNKGNTGAKLDSYKAITPLIVSGETELADNSIKNRMVSVELTLKNKANFEVFEYLKNTQVLEKLGHKAIQNRIENGAKKLSREGFKKLLPKITDDRQIFNLTCILKGVSALNDIIKIPEEINKKFLEYLGKCDQGNVVVRNFEKLLELVVESGNDYSSYYIHGKSKHCARWSMLYKAINEEYYRTNCNLELPSSFDLKKTLRETGYITGEESTRFPIPFGFGSSEAFKAVTFKKK